jgi:hypothetical protein
MITQTWQAQDTAFQAIQAEEKTEALACAPEAGNAGSFQFCNRKQELVHFIGIKLQQRFLKAQTDHSAQLAATLGQRLVNS